jgi:hypothetical protein
MTKPNKIAAGNRHRAFSFDRTMKFEYQFALFSSPPWLWLSSSR